MAPRWITAFLDLPAGHVDDAVGFWRSVTGYALSPSRGEHDEFATLLPPSGDAYLRVQRIRSGEPGVHLDLHRPGQRFAVRRSPGGLLFCLVPGDEASVPPPARWDDGTRSVVDQVCLDIPPAIWEDECAFWASLTGWELAQGGRPEFRRLRRPVGQPLGLLLQCLDEGDAPVRAHLDLAADDREAEVRRHERSVPGSWPPARGGPSCSRRPARATASPAGCRRPS